MTDVSSIYYERLEEDIISNWRQQRELDSPRRWTHITEVALRIRLPMANLVFNIFLQIILWTIS